MSSGILCLRLPLVAWWGPPCCGGWVLGLLQCRGLFHSQVVALGGQQWLWWAVAVVAVLGCKVVNRLLARRWLRLRWNWLRQAVVRSSWHLCFSTGGGVEAPQPPRVVAPGNLVRTGFSLVKKLASLSLSFARARDRGDSPARTRQRPRMLRRGSGKSAYNVKAATPMERHVKPSLSLPAPTSRARAPASPSGVFEIQCIVGVPPHRLSCTCGVKGKIPRQCV